MICLFKKYMQLGLRKLGKTIMGLAPIQGKQVSAFTIPPEGDLAPRNNLSIT
jgi:hypothetical protein